MYDKEINAREKKRKEDREIEKGREKGREIEKEKGKRQERENNGESGKEKRERRCSRICVSSEGIVTKLAGARRMSPMPPPLRRPWLSVVTMHMISESQLRSRTSPPTDTNRLPREHCPAPLPAPPPPPPPPASCRYFDSASSAHGCPEKRGSSSSDKHKRR